MSNVVTSPYKFCSRCSRFLGLSDFQNDKRRKDGKAFYCRKCQSELDAAYYEKKYGSTHPLKKLNYKSAEERFVASYRVSENGCWLWIGAPQSNFSYGSLKVNGKKIPAHRYSWTRVNGPIPEGLLVCHKCDVPLCVNPDHLFIGTVLDNARDRDSKGRQSRGHKHSQAIFSARKENK